MHCDEDDCKGEGECENVVEDKVNSNKVGPETKATPVREVELAMVGEFAVATVE